MPNYRSLRCGTVGLNFAHGQARSAGSDNNIFWNKFTKLCKNLLLKSKILRHTFLNEFRTVNCVRKIGAAIKIVS